MNQSHKQKDNYRALEKLEIVSGDLRYYRKVWDYIIDCAIDGVEYLVPNDTAEPIMARSHKYGVAVNTGFYDMDDFYEGSDYCFVIRSGLLIPAFELYNDDYFAEVLEQQKVK